MKNWVVMLNLRIYIHIRNGSLFNFGSSGFLVPHQRHMYDLNEVRMVIFSATSGTVHL